MLARVLAISGSRRKDSINRRLLDTAAAMVGNERTGLTVLDWDRIDLPIYDGDLESECGLPTAAVRLKRLVADHDGLLIATPEYNGSITPLLKNAIDWASRPGSPERVFRGKPAALLAASPGPTGGRRGLRHLRDVLSNLGAEVLPEEYALAKALKAWGPGPDDLLPVHRAGIGRVTRALLEALTHSAGASTRIGAGNQT